jgi:periplasmic divalent cation tolerance protein
MFSVCYITAPSMDVAQVLARRLVTQKLVACVNIIPGITSVYEWEGKLNTDDEFLLMAKTQTQLVNQVVAEVKAHHPYKVPEVISVPMGLGHMDYLQWVRDATTKGSSAASAAAQVVPTPSEQGLPK